MAPKHIFINIWNAGRDGLEAVSVPWRGGGGSQLSGRWATTYDGWNICEIKLHFPEMRKRDVGVTTLASISSDPGLFKLYFRELLFNILFPLF